MYLHRFVCYSIISSNFQNRLKYCINQKNFRWILASGSIFLSLSPSLSFSFPILTAYGLIFLFSLYYLLWLEICIFWRGWKIISVHHLNIQRESLSCFLELYTRKCWGYSRIHSYFQKCLGVCLVIVFIILFSLCRKFRISCTKNLIGRINKISVTFKICFWCCFCM